MRDWEEDYATQAETAARLVLNLGAPLGKILSDSPFALFRNGDLRLQSGGCVDGSQSFAIGVAGLTASENSKIARLVLRQMNIWFRRIAEQCLREKVTTGESQSLRIGRKMTRERLGSDVKLPDEWDDGDHWKEHPFTE